MKSSAILAEDKRRCSDQGVEGLYRVYRVCRVYRVYRVCRVYRVYRVCRVYRVALAWSLLVLIVSRMNLLSLFAMYVRKTYNIHK